MCSESARSSMDRASGFEPEGWEFESLRARIFGSPGAFTAPERPENALYSSQSDECAQKKAGLYSSQSDECAQKKAGLYSSQSDECAQKKAGLYSSQSDECAQKKAGLYSSQS